MSKAEQEPEPLKKAAAFMAGFSIFMLFLLVVSASKFSAVRFNITQSCIILYINRMIVSFRACALFGMALMILYDQYIGHKMSLISSILGVLLSLLYGFALFAHCTGGTQGHITLYYWAIVLTSFVYGLVTISIGNVASGDIAFFLGSMPVAGILMSLYHIVFLSAVRTFQISNVDYWIVLWQLVISTVTSAISAILWIVAYSGELSKVDDSTGAGNATSLFGAAFVKALSPLLMVSFGFGLQNFFYPAIAPYQLTGVKNGYNISLAILLTGAIPPLVILILKENHIGPNVPWNAEKWWWHLGWIFYFIELLCGILFLVTLHNPGCAISRRINSSVRFAGFLTVLYDFCVQTTKTIGANGATMQEGTKHPKMSAFTIFSYSFIQLSLAFVGDGYLATYKKAEMDLDNWPTKHYGTLRAFWFWTWSAIKYACKKVLNTYTLDLRGVILGKKDYIFIVYTDG